MTITPIVIRDALTLLGGTASVEDIHKKVLEITPSPHAASSRQIVRARLQENCPESGSYRGRDLFRSVHGLAANEGIWALSGFVEPIVENNTSRNPPWSRDELILALDLYFKNPVSPPAKGTKAVAELSAVLNKMHRINGIIGAPTLRNENGVYLKMMNLRSLDPAVKAQGKVGMQSGGALEKTVWAEYADRTADLVADASLIRSVVLQADEPVVAKLPNADPYEGEEGGVVMRLHKRYERDAKLVSEKRKAAIENGQLACEVCHFDFRVAYGDLGLGYIEVHHISPVFALSRGSKTKLSDLALLCANCHRMAHRRRLPMSLDELREALAGSVPSNK